MSLRLRLTLLFTTLLGGMLLIFGSLVYGVVSLVLYYQLDNHLSASATQLIDLLRLNTSNEYDVRLLANFQSSENLFYQVYGPGQDLQLAHPGSMDAVLDPVGRASGEPLFTSQVVEGRHLRVLSVPLRTERGPAGMLQVAESLTSIDAAQNVLARTLIILAVVTLVIFGIIIWQMTGQALAPLAAVTETARQISRAADLQRRIPMRGSANDEVGSLVEAFNKTLERMEVLFNSQKRFLTDVSHELRTPLTVIKGNIGLLRQQGVTDEESLSSTEQEVDRLTRLVGDLLFLAQAETGSMPLAMLPVELDTVLLEVFQQMSMLAGDKLVMKITEIDQIQVKGDRDRLKQVLVNLLGNAIQYTPAGGEVRIALRKVGSQAQLSITDTGPGIPPEDLPHIFERFYRGEKSRRRSQGSGFGLGLSIAFWIVRNHGGSIEADSREGAGSTFCVWLPLLAV